MTAGAVVKIGTSYATDISDYCYRVEINRGRNRELDEINAGTCTVYFRNYDRSFDPSFAGSNNPSVLLLENEDDVLKEDGFHLLLEDSSVGQFGTIRPGSPVRIQTENAVTVFTGWVEDWQYVYTPQGVYEGSFVAVDALGRLGRRELAEHTGTAAELGGARISRILNRSEIDWSGSTDIDAGLTTFQADSVDEGTNCLNYLQLVAATEAGRLFSSRTGAVTFRNRGNIIQSTSSITFSDIPASGVPFQSVDVVFGSDLLYTRVTVERVGGTAQTVNASASALAEFEIRSLTISGLLMDGDEEAEGQASFYAQKFSEPEAVVTALAVALDRSDINTSERNTIAGLEVGDACQVLWTPTGAGAQNDQTLTVEGIQHSFAIGSPHVVSLSLSNPGDKYGFILDSATLGVLNTSRLGY